MVRRRLTRGQSMLAAALIAVAASCSSEAVTTPTPTASTTTTTTTTVPPTTASNGSLSLSATQWEALSVPDYMPLQNTPNGQLTFAFPSQGSINYIYSTAPPEQISGSVSVTMQVTGSGPVVFDYMTEPFNTCVTASTVRPFIWANHTGFGEFDRWWSNPTAYELAPGAITLTVPLTSDRWSSVYGKFGNADPTAEAGFTRALRNVSQLGLTFGGGCFYGHGVRVKGGSANFFVSSYQVK